MRACHLQIVFRVSSEQTRQEWSSMRMHQIKDVVAWELDRLTQDLHEQLAKDGSYLPKKRVIPPTAWLPPHVWFGQ